MCSLIALLLLGSACKGTEVPGARAITMVELSAKSYWSFDRDWWRVVYRRDGTCEWTGNTQTDRTGQYVGELGNAQWESVVNCIEGLGIERLRSHYEDPDAHDAQQLVLTVHRGAVSKTIDDYNRAGPAEMRQAESILLGLADQVEWRVRPR